MEIPIKSKAKTSKPLRWSRKGMCPACFANTGTNHKTNCELVYVSTRIEITKVKCEVLKCDRYYEVENYFNPIMDEDGCRMSFDRCPKCTKNLLKQKDER